MLPKVNNDPTSLCFRDNRCRRKEETEIYMDPVKTPEPEPAHRLSLSSGAFLDQEDYADIWCAHASQDPDGQTSSGYRSLDTPPRSVMDQQLRSSNSVIHDLGEPAYNQSVEGTIHGPCAIHGTPGTLRGTPHRSASGHFTPSKSLRVAVGQRQLANVDLVHEVGRDIIHHVNCRAAGHAWQMHGGGDGRYDLPPHENVYMYRTVHTGSGGWESHDCSTDEGGGTEDREPAPHKNSSILV